MYKLPYLPYSFDELEPFIDTHTLGLHYHKHEQNYLDKLNKILIKNKYDYRYDINELIYHIDEFNPKDKEDILFNLGGILNHNLYWNSMNPNSSLPNGNLLFYINKTYGNYDNFWEIIKEKALSLKGSGYTFLVLRNDSNLDIINVSNQQTPLLFGFIPLFNIDMWEHAYYLNYKNNKEEYLDNFKLIADFCNASNIFNSIIK